MRPISQLLLLASRYGESLDAKQTTVSWRAFGDSKKLRALEAGADIQVKRLELTIQWFSDNWPEGAAWPADVPRPASAVVAA